MNLHFWDKFDLCNRQYLICGVSLAASIVIIFNKKISSALDIRGMGIFIKRFIEVRQKTLTCFLIPIYAETFEFYSLVFTLVLICEQRPQSAVTFRNAGMLRVFENFPRFVSELNKCILEFVPNIIP